MGKVQVTSKASCNTFQSLLHQKKVVLYKNVWEWERKIGRRRAARLTYLRV